MKSGSLLFGAMFTLAMFIATVSPSRAGALAGWTTLKENGSYALACKTAENSSLYGPLWKITIAALSTNPGKATINLRVHRNGLATPLYYVGNVTAYAYNGQWKLNTIYASRWYSDVYYTTGTVNNISFSTPFRDVSSLATCQ